MQMRMLLFGMLFAGLAARSSAAVVESSPATLLMRNEVTIAATPHRTYEALLQPASWWSPQHTFSGDAKNLSLDARPGGCFCERFPKGGGVEHMRIIYLAPDQLIRMSGALGPFQSAAVTGSMTWELTADAKQTTVRLTYAIGGFMSGGLDKIGPIADTVLLEQLQRLKRFVETGKADALK
ncbi:MAG: SRPBCC domain-containing protein [Acidobacteriota bacterium]|nr:SRPBCC domain-containing protein [Acidobacteriota bacterium]